MIRAGFLYDPSFLEHYCTLHEHPERPERLASVLNGLKSAGVWEDALKIAPRPATRDELHAVHTESYVTSVLNTLEREESGNLDPDTFFSSGSRQAALNAAGGGIDLTLAVHDRQVDWGFAVVRPPGHHATWNRACGFCIFNNIAVAASTLLTSGKAERVAILDWDVHHGNGTQDQFWDNPDVLYISMHQWPFFPGSGALSELGGSNALGKTVNLPLPAQSTDNDYLVAMDKVVLPLLDAFLPSHIMISAGFDANEQDPLASMHLSSDCFGQLATRIKRISNRLCDGRLTLFLEGGYSLNGLEESTLKTTQGLLDEMKLIPIEDTHTSSPSKKVITKAILGLAPHWPKVFSDIE